MQQWFILGTAQEYEHALAHYEKLKHAAKGTKAHKEKMLLANLINDYENRTIEWPDVDPIETIKIRMEDFGYKATDLAQAYGDKGTVSKVLNYKQPLSLNMIRAFSKLLKIPAASLIKEYNLQ
jgi:HTH-type transcriptional regulator/antitoxin HigA